MVLDGKSPQEFIKAPFLVLHLSYYTLMTFSMMLSVILLIYNTAAELEYDLRDTMDWGRKWLVDFNAGKTELVLYDRSYNTGAIDVKIDGTVFD